MASPRAAVSILKCLSPQKISANIRPSLSPKTPVKNSLSIESVFQRNPISPTFRIDTPYKNKIINEGFLEESRKIIGSGAFGTVYKACYQGKEVAAKIIKNIKSKSNSADIEKKAAFLNHSNIVKVLKIDKGPALTLITMELCGNSLETVLEESSISKKQRIHIWKSIGKALKYCHQMGIVHADVKPRNVLMCNDDQPKLSDFGSAIFTNEPYTPFDFHGTPGYAAPEVVCGTTPTPSSDIYSLGVLAWQMLSRKPPFADLHKHTILYLTGKGITPSDYNLDDGFEGKYKDLYKRSWNKSCENRPTINVIIKQLNSLEIEFSEVP